MNDQHLAKPQGRASRALNLDKQLNKDCMTTTNRKSFAEFFSGIGLMRLGLEKEGWSVAFANDIDEQKVMMYTAHFGEENSHIVHDDIHNLSAESIPTVRMQLRPF